MAREIGLSRITVFPLQDSTTVMYGAPIGIPWAVSLEVSKTLAEYEAYGDNVAEISSSKETGAELTIEVSSDMAPELESKIVGKKYKNGALVSTTDDVKQSYAAAWETLMSDGKLRRYCYFNCTFSKDEQSNETVSDSITAQTYNLTGKAIPLPTTKELMMVMDEKEYEAIMNQTPDHPKKNEIKELWEKWFEKAPRPVE